MPKPPMPAEISGVVRHVLKIPDLASLFQYGLSHSIHLLTQEICLSLQILHLSILSLKALSEVP